MTERVTIVRSEIERVDTLCAGIVIRQGEMDACCKHATTIVYDREHASLWPACTWHANRYGGALTLAQIRGERAADWSYEGSCPDERRQSHGSPYCTHSDHYQPRCRPCHRAHDRKEVDADV